MVANLARADEPAALVGLARVDITPDYPVRLTGYANRKTEYEGVDQRLFAKALAIGSDQDSPAILITVDNLGVPASMTAEVAARLEKKCGLKPERLAICSSHTHSAPALKVVAPLIFVGDITEDQIDRIARYSRDLTDRLEEVATHALADRRPGRLAWSEGKVDLAINRRKMQDGKWTGFGEVPAGPVDQSMPMLRVTDADGKLRGILVNYACHCTTLGGRYNRVGGDWAGYAQEIIEREHPGAVAMVAIGCGADANPNYRGDTPDYPRKNGEKVAQEVERLLASTFQPVSTKITARHERIELPFDKLPTREEFAERAKQKGPIAHHAAVNLARLERGEVLPTKLPYDISTWQFGNDLTMVFLAGEVVVDYALRLKSELPGRRLWITAYANDNPCYIASRRVLAEGGYEVDSSMYYYDRPTHFDPAVEDLIVETVHRLLK
jgi:hypothetical protein